MRSSASRWRFRSASSRSRLTSSVAHLRTTWQFVLFTGKPLKYDFWPGYWTEELHVDSILALRAIRLGW